MALGAARAQGDDSDGGIAARTAAKASKPYRATVTSIARRACAARRGNELDIERVARRRRALPLAATGDYEFIDENGRRYTADMFGAHDTLVTYFWMYGPKRERPCPMCTSLIGSLDTPARDLRERVSLAIIGRSPVSRQLAFARERGWTNLNFYQCVGDDFAKHYRGLAEDGSEWPALDVWVRRGAKVHHFWAGESSGTQDPGQDPHGAPDPAPLWIIRPHPAARKRTVSELGARPVTAARCQPRSRYSSLHIRPPERLLVSQAPRLLDYPA
jgi:predicted dithiol-disulfide oxidoreductase (DUF899 family)